MFNLICIFTIFPKPQKLYQRKASLIIFLMLYLNFCKLHHLRVYFNVRFYCRSQMSGTSYYFGADVNHSSIQLSCSYTWSKPQNPSSNYVNSSEAIKERNTYPLYTCQNVRNLHWEVTWACWFVFQQNLLIHICAQ